MTTRKTSSKPKPAASATAKHSRTRKVAAPKTGRAGAPIKPKAESDTTPKVSVPELKKKELIDLAVAASGIEKRSAKPVVEAVLSILGEKISEGREMNLQPFGKVKYNRIVEKDNARVVILKLRQAKAATISQGSPNEPVAKVKI